MSSEEKNSIPGQHRLWTDEYIFVSAGERVSVHTNWVSGGEKRRRKRRRREIRSSVGRRTHARISTLDIDRRAREEERTKKKKKRKNSRLYLSPPNGQTTQTEQACVRLCLNLNASERRMK